MAVVSIAIIDLGTSFPGTSFNMVAMETAIFAILSAIPGRRLEFRRNLS